MPGERQPSRRGLLAAGIGAAALGAGAAEAQPSREVVVVSRERILREARAARRLRDAEEEMTARLQSQIDDTKVQFADEEEELTRLRGELASADFEARIADFDQRVRSARRIAQERAATLQKGFQEARASIVAALPGLMERLRLDVGARLVVNADQVLAADPALDMTDRAVALFDADGPMPAVPGIDLSAPLTEPHAEPPTMPRAEPPADPPADPPDAPAAEPPQPVPAPGRPPGR